MSNDERKIKKLPARARSLTPLALVTLAACQTTSGDGGVNIGGAVVKGPLQNARVFLDLDGDGVAGSAGDISTTTDENGQYTFTGVDPALAAVAQIIAVTTPETVDTSSNTSLDGVTLKAPAGASVVTPATTVISESDGAITKEQVAKVLGLPEGVDPLTFNPFGEGVDAAQAAQVEIISQQLVATVKTFAAAAEGREPHKKKPSVLL